MQAPSDWFGHSANLDGDLLIVGAPSDSTWGDFAGEAFIYRFDGASWVLEDEIIGPDTGAYERFGWDVAIDGDVAAATRSDSFRQSRPIGCGVCLAARRHLVGVRAEARGLRCRFAAQPR